MKASIVNVIRRCVEEAIPPLFLLSLVATDHLPLGRGQLFAVSNF
jgi:hypothetical protein